MIGDLTRRTLLGRIAGTVAAAGFSAKLGAQETQPFRIVGKRARFSDLIAPDALPETFAEIPGLRGEGPLWRNGELWLSDLLASRIYAVAPGGGVRIVTENAGGVPDRSIPTIQGPNGLANWRDGALVFCRTGHRDIGIRSKDGAIASFVSSFNGKRFNSPNDIAVHRDGSVWFTDPPLGLPGHPLARPAYPADPPRTVPYPLDQQIPFSGVYRCSEGQAVAAITDMTAPNGLAFSPDGRTLYVNNALPDMYVRAYRVRRDGTLSHGREIYRFPAGTPQNRGLPDGLKIDAEGNLWMAGPGGIHVLAPNGDLLGLIELPSRATNLAFGEDGRSLFIVSNPRILRLRTKVKGLALPFATH